MCHFSQRYEKPMSPYVPRLIGIKRPHPIHQVLQTCSDWMGSFTRTWQKACSILRAACRSRSRRKARYQPVPSFHHRIKAKSRPSDHPSDNMGYIFQRRIANYLCFSGLASSVHFSGLLSSGIRPEKICS